MKILRNIIVGIGVLAALLCALIILSAMNPGITQTLSSLLSGDGRSSQEESGSAEESESYGDEESSVFDMPSETSSEAGGEEETSEDDSVVPEKEEEMGAGQTVQHQPEEPDRSYSRAESSGERVRGMNGYEPPSESGVSVPEAVSGKSGYQPITEKSEELPDAEGGEYTSDLGYEEAHVC